MLHEKSQWERNLHLIQYILKVSLTLNCDKVDQEDRLFQVKVKKMSENVEDKVLHNETNGSDAEITWKLQVKTKLKSVTKGGTQKQPRITAENERSNQVMHERQGSQQKSTPESRYQSLEDLSNDQSASVMKPLCVNFMAESTGPSGMWAFQQPEAVQ